MMMSEIVFKKLPTVLSFQRGMLISDGLFFNQIEDGALTPLYVVRHGIRGTQNVSSGDLKKDNKTDKTSKDSVSRDVSNIQTTDSAKLDANAQALVVKFDVRFIDLRHLLFAVADDQKDKKADKDYDLVTQYRNSVDQFITRAQEDDSAASGLTEVARRFARNIMNGRWLWRNRTLAQGVQIAITTTDNNGQRTPKIVCDALAVSLRAFDHYSEQEQQLAAVIADDLRGRAMTTIHVEASVNFGVRGAVEVFPSQNYVEKKPRGFARPLYYVGHPQKLENNEATLDFIAQRRMGQAALRDQKMSNALRTIDTWYTDYANHKRPVPVEPNGASLDAQRFFRLKESAFEYAKQFNTLDPNSAAGQFMIASLIRGGVLSGG
jgi:CRISPR-associated protein Csy3